LSFCSVFSVLSALTVKKVLTRRRVPVTIGAKFSGWRPRR